MDGVFRLPWPGELDGDLADVFCPRCAKEMLARIQSGEFAFRYGLAENRNAASS